MHACHVTDIPEILKLIIKKCQCMSSQLLQIIVCKLFIVEMLIVTVVINIATLVLSWHKQLWLRNNNN